jgi:hypothetical protein
MKQAPLPIWTTEGPIDMALQGVEMDGPKTTPFERRFNPYDFNGGCVPVVFQIVFVFPLVFNGF